MNKGLSIVLPEANAALQSCPNLVCIGFIEMKEEFAFIIH